MIEFVAGLKIALAVIGGWFVLSILFAAAWMGMHSSARERYAAPPRRSIDKDRRPLPIDAKPVCFCKNCGPTAAAIEHDGLCWRCAPVVRAVHASYHKPPFAA